MIQKREKIAVGLTNKCVEWIRFWEEVMLNTKEMKQVTIKLPDSLKEHVFNALFEVQWFSGINFI